MSRAPSFRAVRWLRSLNLLAQAVLLLTLFGGVNYLALHYGWRFDLTQERRHSLSPETLAYLEGLGQPVRIIVTLTDDKDNPAVAQAYHDVTGLLSEYVYATEKKAPNAGRISVETLDVYQRRNDSKALGLDQPNVVLVLCGKRSHLVTLNELYRVENKVKKAFLGEQAITAAVLDVANPVKKKIYFLTGHGEMQTDDVSPDRGLSGLNDELRARNLDLAPLDLTRGDPVPPDAALLVIAGPQSPYSPAEAEQLRQYMSNHAGRLLALLNPRVRHGLDDLLDDWGVLADDVVTVDNGDDGQNDAGDLILAPTQTMHPVTGLLTSNHIPLRFGAARAMRPDPAHAPDANLVVTALVGTKTAWGERGYSHRTSLSYVPGIDLPGPFAVATAAERVTARGDLPFSVPGGRLVAFGSADWIANGRLSALGNLTLILSAINWTVERDISSNIPVRPIERYQLVLSQQQLRHMYYSLIFVVPGAVALLGCIVWWTRRR